jgi:hypothetical protein
MAKWSTRTTTTIRTVTMSAKLATRLQCLASRKAGSSEELHQLVGFRARIARTTDIVKFDRTS